MAKGRGNPVMESSYKKVISQDVVNPVASAENCSGHNPAKIRKPAKQNGSYTISQKVKNPSDGKER